MNIHQTLTGTYQGLTVARAGTLTFKTGAMIDGLAGYHLNDYLAVEGDLAYAWYDYDRINGTLQIGPIVNNGATFTGNVTYWMGFAHGIVTPLGRTGFSPYLGAGVGFAAYDATIDSVVSPVLGVVALNSETHDTNLGADAIVGSDYPITLGARYRFIWTDSARSSVSGKLVGTDGDAYFHVLSITAKYRF